jgi:hypothetical protein
MQHSKLCHSNQGVASILQLHMAREFVYTNAFSIWVLQVWPRFRHRLTWSARPCSGYNDKKTLSSTLAGDVSDAPFDLAEHQAKSLGLTAPIRPKFWVR